MDEDYQIYVLKQCEAILDDMCSDQFFKLYLYDLSDEFRTDLLHYYQITKKHIDLCKMKKKFDEGAYTRVEQFLDDVQLLVENCINAFPATHKIAVFANLMERKYLSKFKKFKRNYVPVGSRIHYDVEHVLVSCREHHCQGVAAPQLPNPELGAVENSEGPNTVQSFAGPMEGHAGHPDHVPQRLFEPQLTYHSEFIYEWIPTPLSPRNEQSDGHDGHTSTEVRPRNEEHGGERCQTSAQGASGPTNPICPRNEQRGGHHGHTSAQGRSRNEHRGGHQRHTSAQVRPRNEQRGGQRGQISAQGVSGGSSQTTQPRARNEGRGGHHRHASTQVRSRNEQRGGHQRHTSAQGVSEIREPRIRIRTRCEQHGGQYRQPSAQSDTRSTHEPQNFHPIAPGQQFGFRPRFEGRRY